MKPTYAEYRGSDVEWIGHVPAHWDVPSFRQVCRLEYGDALPFEQREAGDVPVYGSNGVVGVHCDANTLAPAIIVGRKGSHGKVNFEAGRAFAIDTTYFVDRRSTGSNLRWLYYVLKSAGLDQTSKDSAVPGLSREDTHAMHLPLPPIDEQRAIAAHLDSETTRIDKLISMQESLIERLDEYRTALITQTVTEGLPPEAAEAAGLDPAPKLKDSGVEWLGEVPEHWEIARLKWSTTGCTGGVWGDEPDGVDDLLCVRVADFDRRSGRVSLQNPTQRSVPMPHREGRTLGVGDLLLEKSGGGVKQLVGCVVLYDHEVPAVCSNFVGRVALAENADPAYWAYVHRALYAGKLNYPAIKQTTGIQNLDTNAYFDTAVAFPPYPEQIAIAEYLDTAIDRIDALRTKAELSIERLSEYRSAVISAAVTGKIDVSDGALAGAGGGA